MISLKDKEKAENLMRQLMVFMGEFDDLQKTFSRIRNEMNELFEKFEKEIKEH